MAMNENTLKTVLKGDLIDLFEECKSEKGLSEEAYADKLAGIIAKRVVEHITTNAVVSPGTDWLAGGYPVAGSASGTIS
jgi:hypothetical protein